MYTSCTPSHRFKLQFRHSNFCFGDMSSGLIPGLNPSINSPEDELVVGQIPASLLSFFTSEVVTVIVAGATVISTVMIGSLLWTFYSKKKIKVGEICSDEAHEVITGEADRNSPDVRIDEGKYKLLPSSDVHNAEDLLLQEVLFAPLFTSQMESRASSSALTPELSETAKEAPEPSQSFCEICMENQEIWQMFINSTCSHSFCYNCTSKFIMAKIQETVNVITCPGINCSDPLDPGACRLMIPKDIVICWDESLCKSLIEESQKVYCPFRDCMALLVNDSGTIITETKCPECRRLFCAGCNVPWHSDFTCNEFLKLNGKKKWGIDLLVEKLAKKKKWRKCPSCKFYVEKSQGCLHIVCRCKYEFCYRCGSNWSSNTALAEGKARPDGSNIKLA